MLTKLKWILALTVVGGLLWLWFAVDWGGLLPSFQSVVRTIALLVGLFVLYKVGTKVWERTRKNYQRQMGNLSELRGKGSKTHGSAEFSTRGDLKKANLLGDKGVVLGKFDNKFLRFSQPGHLITFAPTRSGKGVGHVIPNLLTHPGSVFVNDIKGENYAVTSRYRAGFTKVFRFAPFEESSDCFNPIDYIRVNTDNELDDVKLIAEMMIVDDGAQDKFWMNEARTWVEGLLMYVAHESPPPLRNIAEVRYLLMQNRKDFELMVEDMMRCKHPFIKKVANSITATEPKVAASVLSTAKSQTAIWDSPKLQKVTAKSDFKLESLKTEPTSIYLIIPPEALAVYSPLVRMLVGMAVKAMTRDQSMPKDRVLFLIDEFPALKYMSPIEEAVGFLAGYGIHLWMFIQDLSQIKDLYKRWETFISNCAVRMAFGTNDVDTAKTLSDMLGTTTIQVVGVGTQSKGTFAKLNPLNLVSSGGGKSLNTSDTARALMTPDEVMRLPHDSQLIFVQGQKPIVAEKLFYFSDPFFAGKFDKWRG